MVYTLLYTSYIRKKLFRGCICTQIAIKISFSLQFCFSISIRLNVLDDCNAFMVKFSVIIFFTWIIFNSSVFAEVYFFLSM